MSKEYLIGAVVGVIISLAAIPLSLNAQAIKTAVCSIGAQ